MENTKSISFPYSSTEEFEQRQKELFKEAFNETMAQLKKRVDDDTFLTRKQVAERLHISLPTLHSLTKEGTLVGYRLNGRVLYKKEDIVKSLKQIATLKQPEA